MEERKAKVGWTPVCARLDDPLTLDGKHPVTKIFEVDLPMRVRVQVPGELLHLGDRDKGGRAIRRLEATRFSLLLKTRLPII